MLTGICLPTYYSLSEEKTKGDIPLKKKKKQTNKKSDPESQDLTIKTTARLKFSHNGFTTDLGKIGGNMGMEVARCRGQGLVLSLDFRWKIINKTLQECSQAFVFLCVFTGNRRNAEPDWEGKKAAVGGLLHGLGCHSSSTSTTSCRCDPLQDASPVQLHLAQTRTL